jgi:hypothetical protein
MFTDSEYSPRIIQRLQALNKFQDISIIFSIKSQLLQLTSMDAHLVKDLCKHLPKFSITFQTRNEDIPQEFWDELELYDDMRYHGN